LDNGADLASFDSGTTPSIVQFLPDGRGLVFVETRPQRMELGRDFYFSELGSGASLFSKTGLSQRLVQPRSRM
jgi:hypothetical protein